MNRPPALVIFDCDGVLVDSEPIAARILAECLAEAGLGMSVEAANAFGVGKSAATLVAAVEAEFGRKLPEGFIARMRARVIAAFSEELTPMDGVAALLSRLALPKCVASNSHITRVRHALAATGLLGHFDPHLYTAAMVTRAKPAPDLFLHAAAQMGAAAADCLVVEDSLHGVAAARAAGMTAIGFCGGSHCPAGHGDILRAAGCAAVFAGMDRLAEYLGGARTKGAEGRR